MAKKVCSAGVAGSFSYLVLDQQGIVHASIRNDNREVAVDMTDMHSAEHWTEQKLRDLIGKRYEVDRI